MPSWMTRILDIVWTAVLSVVAIIVGLLVALVSPNSTALVIALAGTAIALALLSQRD